MNTINTFLISTSAACLTLCIGVSAQGDAFAYTTLDVPGATRTHAYGIDGGNIVGIFYDGSGGYRGFLAVIPEPATLSLLALGMLMACRRRR